MELAEAKAVVAAIQAFRPWPEIPPSTVEAWCTVLIEYDATDALEAVPVIGRGAGFLGLPEIEDAIREARAVRLSAERRKALPARQRGGGMDFGTWLREEATDEQRAAVARMSPAVRRALEGETDIVPAEQGVVASRDPS